MRHFVKLQPSEPSMYSYFNQSQQSSAMPSGELYFDLSQVSIEQALGTKSTTHLQNYLAKGQNFVVGLLIFLIYS